MAVRVVKPDSTNRSAEAPVGDNSLTPGQQAFVREFIVDLDGPQAAIRAGHPRRGAAGHSAALLAQPAVHGAIVEGLSGSAPAHTIGDDWVLEQLKRIAEYGAAIRPILDKERAATGQYAMVDAPSALKAIELVGRHLGLFADQRGLSGEPPQVVISGLEAEF